MNYTIEFEPSGIRLVCEEPLTISDARDLHRPQLDSAIPNRLLVPSLMFSNPLDEVFFQKHTLLAYLVRR
jgi:hypothetical protein